MCCGPSGWRASGKGEAGQFLAYTQKVMQRPRAGRHEHKSGSWSWLCFTLCRMQQP